MQHLSSRESLSSTTDTLLSVAADLDDSGLQTLGGELRAVASLFRQETAVRRALADGSVDGDTRVTLADRLLRGKVSAPTLQVVDAVVTAEWATSINMLDAFARLGRTAMFLRAERNGQLDTVEDQIFRFGRILDGNPELAAVLDDQTGSPEAKRALVQRLIGEKAEPLTVELLTELAADTHGRSYSFGVDQLVEEAAHRQEKTVAIATSAVALSTEQHERLAAALRNIYRRPVVLHVEVDPSLVGGIVVRVGDEVIDGSVSGRIAELRAKLGG